MQWVGMKLCSHSCRFLLVKRSADPPASVVCSFVGSFIFLPSLSKGGGMTNWNTEYWPRPYPVALMSLVIYFVMIEIGGNFDTNLESKICELLGFWSVLHGSHTGL